MASIFEIVDKLRAGEEVIIHNKYQFTVMQQIEDHGSKIGYLKPIKFEPHDKKHTRLTLER
jgi:hypothetical protein